MNDPVDYDQATNDLIDEILELDFEDMVTSKDLRKAYQKKHLSDMPSREYYHNLLQMQAEMIKLQDWVKETNAKVLIICEGRDSAGKGSVIKRITQRMTHASHGRLRCPNLQNEKCRNGTFSDMCHICLRAAK